MKIGEIKIPLNRRYSFVIYDIFIKQDAEDAQWFADKRNATQR